MVVVAAVVLSAIQIAVRLSIAAGVLASALVVGALLVSGLGADPVVTRSASALRCQPGSPRVCLWPENESVASLVSREAERIGSNLARIGIRAPQVVSEARSAAGRTWLIGVTPEAQVIDIDSTLIQGLLPSYPACADGTIPYFGYDAFWPVALWLGQKTGARLQGLQRNLTDEERREVSAVSKLTLAAQLSWYRTNRRAIGHCNVKPHFLTEKL